MCLNECLEYVCLFVSIHSIAKWQGLSIHACVRVSGIGVCVPVCVHLCKCAIVEVITRVCASECPDFVCVCLCPSVCVWRGRVSSTRTCVRVSIYSWCVCFFVSVRAFVN